MSNCMKGETRRMEGEMSEILHANHGRDIEHAMSKKAISRMMRMNVKEGAAGIYMYPTDIEKYINQTN